MNALNIADYMQTLGLQAKTASAQVARASAAIKNRALLNLAGLLRQNLESLQTANQRDLERAAAAGLAGPLLDRLKLGAKDLETVALGCEQLAAMPDVIGEIIGMKEQPSGIRVGQMRVPIGVFGMIYESRPNVTIEAAVAGHQERQRLHPARRLRGHRVEQGAGRAGAPGAGASRPAGRRRATGAEPPTARPSAS